MSSSPGNNNDEVERLRSILRHVHEPRKSFTGKIFRGITSRLSARIQKKAIAERIEKPPKQNAA